MNTLFDGTSRLAQMALVTAVSAVLFTAFSAAFFGAAKFGPFLLVVAGGMALWTYVRDREDDGMWPAYATFVIVLVGIVVSIPLVTNASAARKLGELGKSARQESIIPLGAMEQAMKSCVRDGVNNTCTARSIAATEVAGAKTVFEGRDCDNPGQLCVSDDAQAGYRVEFVTQPIKGLGSLRFEESRTLQNQLLATTCRAMDADADAAAVRAACGPGVTIGEPAGN